MKNPGGYTGEALTYAEWAAIKKPPSGAELARRYAEKNRMSGSAWDMPEAVRRNIMRFAFRAGYRAGRKAERDKA